MKPANGCTILTRKQVAEALTAAGYPITVKKLKNYAQRDQGPRLSHVGSPRGSPALYRWCDALEWAVKRSMTSERRPS